MPTTPTQLPVPSGEPQDFKFNIGKIDQFVTSQDHEYIDRLGGKHRTIAGINYDANQAILNYGYITKDSFEDGSTLSLASECLRWESNGEHYRWDGEFPKVVPPNSTPESAGGLGSGKWVGVGDASLRSDLSKNDGINIVGGSGIYSYVANGIDDSSGLSVASSEAVSRGEKLNIVGIAKVVSPVVIEAQINDSLNQIFTLDSNVLIYSPQTKVRPEMFGDFEGALDKCIQALPSTGGSIYLESARYKTSRYQYGFSGAGKYIGKDNVSIIGKRNPDGDYSLSKLIDGSIIEGCVLVWANNFTISDVGIDTGIEVLNASYGGVDAAGITEGLILTYPNDAAKESGDIKTGARLHNITALASRPTAPVHAVIVSEGFTGTKCTGLIHGIMGVHGVVIKSSYTSVDDIIAECQGENSIVIKSDEQSGAISSNISIKSAKGYRAGINREPHTNPPTDGTSGIVMHVTGSNGIDNISIGEFSSIGNAFGIKIVKTNSASIINVSINRKHVDCMGATGVTSGVYYPDQTNSVFQINIDESDFRNGQKAFYLGNSPNFVTTGKLDTKNTTDCLADIQGASQLTINTVSFMNNAGSGKWRINSGAKIKVGSTTVIGADSPEFATGGDSVTLNPGHSSTTQPITARLVNFGLELDGLVTSANGEPCITLPASLCPTRNIRSSTAIKNASTAISVGVITVGADGAVIVNEGSAAPTEWGSIATHFAL